MQSLSLTELNELVRQALELTMPSPFWVRAEIAECRVAANGHCYMELVEHDEATGQIRSKARANLWRSTYAFLRPRFERETGQRLQAGLQVLLEVQVSFHPQFGYALTVSDIDPTFTLGDAARRRREILRQLEEDGVLRMNQELSLPRPIRRVAVVSSATAAGYGDFCHQMESARVPILTRLFPATMQGENVEASVIEALNRIDTERGEWDAVCIIRGGGATTDLGGFESYLLAANVAQFPLPVITGIGHERDETVIDLVAHTRLKTPTAVAAFLIAQWQECFDEVQDMERRLQSAVKGRISEAQLQLSQTDKRLLHATAQRLLSARRQLAGLNGALSSSAVRQVSSRQAFLKLSAQRLTTAAADLLREQHHRLDLTEKALTLADPAHILQRGYSITRRDGKAVRSAADLKPGDRITTTLSQGEITSTI